MNILVINGSPKGEKSNTFRLTSAFLDGITESEKQKGSVPEIKIYHTTKLDIKPCRGCFACWNKTPGKCCIGDEMSDIITDMINSDIIIWSFPLYYFSVPSPLKNVIDRLLPMNEPFMSTASVSGGHPSRYDMSGKKNVLISTCGFYTAENNYNAVTEMFDRFIGKDKYTALFCGQGELFRVKELSARTDEYLNAVKTAGGEFVSGGISEAVEEELNELLYPRDVFETMADADWGVNSKGEKEDEVLTFTRQMAALYNKNTYPGHDIILDMNYTDRQMMIRIILGKDGSHVTEETEGKFTTRINTSYDLWRDIAAGKIAGADALMQHKYSVEGDFDLMIHWDEYFGADKIRTEKKKKSTEAVTDMKILLLPWIVFWVAAAINGIVGSIISLGACAVIPLLFIKKRFTVYDRLSSAGVILCSVLILTGISNGIAVPLSYFLFGIMWTVSVFLKIPLTAHYSMNDYNGESALENPIFVKTNRILTLCWGILYLLTPVWTYFLMKTPAGSYAGAVNSVLPVLMGIFTAWFQKYYPARIAKG